MLLLEKKKKEKKEKFQPGFRLHHSTEMAPLKTVKITNDLLLATNQGCISLLLELSAVFDTDHDVLLDRLQNYICIQGQALWWSG